VNRKGRKGRKRRKKRRGYMGYERQKHLHDGSGSQQRTVEERGGIRSTFQNRGRNKRSVAWKGIVDGKKGAGIYHRVPKVDN